ncbi:hypothetical protein AB6A40_008323 [Gnathostoma spinigerum]|uniref:Uncharacterized protein n=1 Tax=Gnathostoma spinigerum TaxID=75299 RepID=A0ABD6ENR1_9BILA
MALISVDSNRVNAEPTTSLQKHIEVLRMIYCSQSSSTSNRRNNGSKRLMKSRPISSKLIPLNLRPSRESRISGARAHNSEHVTTLEDVASELLTVKKVRSHSHQRNEQFFTCSYNGGEGAVSRVYTTRDYCGSLACCRST